MLWNFYYTLQKYKPVIRSLEPIELKTDIPAVQDSKYDYDSPIHVPKSARTRQNLDPIEGPLPRFSPIDGIFML